MSLWFYDEHPFSFSLADEQTELVCELIRRCAADCDELAASVAGPLCCAEVIDFAAARAARDA